MANPVGRAKPERHALECGDVRLPRRLARTLHARRSRTAPIPESSSPTGCDELRCRATLSAGRWLADIERGVLHPGVVVALVDSACGVALIGAARQRFEPIATLDLRIDYLRAGLRAARSLFCRAECYRLTALHRLRARDASGRTTRANRWRSSQVGVHARGSHAARGRCERERLCRSPQGRAASAGDYAPLVALLPYARLPRRAHERQGERLCSVLPFRPGLVGNTSIPALHGGVTAAFMENAAILHLLVTLDQARLPKSIDFSIDYLLPRSRARTPTPIARCRAPGCAWRRSRSAAGRRDRERPDRDRARAFPADPVVSIGAPAGARCARSTSRRGRAKGSAFRAFRALEPQLQSGRDFARPRTRARASTAAARGPRLRQQRQADPAGARARAARDRCDALR